MTALSNPFREAQFTKEPYFMDYLLIEAVFSVTKVEKVEVGCTKCLKPYKEKKNAMICTSGLIFIALQKFRTQYIFVAFYMNKMSYANKI